MRLAFYRFCLWFAEFNLAMAEKSGNRNWLDSCRTEYNDWRGLVQLEEINHA